MFIPTLYLIISAQVAIVLVGLILYLIVMLVSEENRWEEYSDKLKGKIRTLLEYKERFDVVSENLHKQMELTKSQKDEIDQLKQDLINQKQITSDRESTISELQAEIENLKLLKNQLDEKSSLLDESNRTIGELKVQLALIEDQTNEHPDQVNDLIITIENLENENTNLKDDLSTANDSLKQYQHDAKNISTDFNLTAGGNTHYREDQSDFIDNIQARYQQEIDRLKKNYNNQKKIIVDLETSLKAAKDNSNQPAEIDNTMVTKMQQMINESNTIIEMLESEIDTLHADIAKLLAKPVSVETKDKNEDDVFFEHTASGSDEVLVDDTNDESNVFFDASSEIANDIFFGKSENQSSNGLSNSEQENQQTGDSSAKIEQLEAQLESANQMAMILMMSTGDQGNVINFARNSIQFESLKDLAKGMLETVDLFQVKAAIQIRGKEHDPINLSSYGKISPNDNDKLSNQSFSERFIPDGEELLILFKEISLLVKEMPLNDPDKMGRIQDNLATTLELACSQLRSIESSIKIKKNQKILQQVIKSTHDTIQNVEAQFNEQSEMTQKVISSLTGIISNPAMTKGMDPVYRDVFTSIINDGKNKFDEMKQTGLAIDQKFAAVVQRLGSKILM